MNRAVGGCGDGGCCRGWSGGGARRCLAALLIAAIAASCARRGVAPEAAGVPVPVTLKVVNNLSDPLDLRATGEPGITWTGRVGPNTTTDASLGTLLSTARINLRATNPRSAVVSSRDSVPVRDGKLIWIIP